MRLRERRHGHDRQRRSGRDLGCGQSSDEGRRRTTSPSRLHRSGLGHAGPARLGRAGSTGDLPGRLAGACRSKPAPTRTGPATTPSAVTVTDEERRASTATRRHGHGRTTSLRRSRSAATRTSNEGAAYTLTLGAVTDPGTDTVTSYIVHWGDGNATPTARTAPRRTPTPTAPNDYNVTVDLVDEDGTFLDRANAHSVHGRTTSLRRSRSRVRRR